MIRLTGKSAAQARLSAQRKYAQEVLAKGDLPPEIMVKHRRFRELQARVAKSANAATDQEIYALARELLPYLHFRLDDVDEGSQ